jgi:hypothetical protein
VEKRRLGDLLKAIALLKRHGLHAIGVIRAYHARRVAPLMARAPTVPDDAQSIA